MRTEMEEYYNGLLDNGEPVSKRETVSRIAALIKEARAEKTTAKTAIVVRDGSHARYLKNELMKEFDVLFGIDVKSVKAIYLKNNREETADTVHRKTIMAVTLKDLSQNGTLNDHFQNAVKNHFVDTASSLVELLSHIHSALALPKDQIPGLEVIYRRYCEKLKEFGYAEENKLLQSMVPPHYDFLIIDRPRDLYLLEINLLKKLVDTSTRSVILSPSTEETLGKPLLDGERLEGTMETKHVHMGEFPKPSDEIKEAVKLVKTLLFDNTTPGDIGIIAPKAYLEDLSILLEESKIPASFRFNVPVKGNPVHEAFELILKLSSRSAAFNDALRLLKNPLVRIGEDWNEYRKTRHFFSTFIRRYSDLSLHRWKDRAEAEEKRIENMDNSSEKTYSGKKLETLKEYLKKLDSSLGKMQKEGPISAFSKTFLSNIKKCKILQSIEDPTAITTIENAVRTASRTYFNLEKLLLDMYQMNIEIKVSRDDFQAIFRNEIDGKERRVDSQFSDGIQLMTHEQAELRPVEKLILLGAGENAFPSPLSTVALLDRKELSDLGLFDHRKRDRWAKAFFLSILEGCNNIFMSHSLENGGTWSPVVEQFRSMIEPGNIWEKSDAITGKITLQEHLKEITISSDPSSFSFEGLEEAQRLGEVLEKREGSEGSYFGEIGDPREALEKTLMRKGIDHYVWSPSRFEGYMRCPFKFLMENVFNLEQPDEFSDDVDPGERGHLIHDILYEHLSQIDDILTQQKAKFVIDEEKIRKEHIVELSRKKVESLKVPPLQKEKLGAYLYGSGLNDKKLVQSFVDWEMSEAAEPLHLEASFGLKHHKMGGLSVDDHLKISRDGTVLKFHGRIDRIDVLGDYWNVMDYKTGSIRTLGSLKLPSIQLAIYHEGVEKLLSKHCPELSSLKAGGLLYNEVKHPGMSLNILAGKTPRIIDNEDGKNKEIGNILVQRMKKKTALGNRYYTITNLPGRIRQKDLFGSICQYKDPEDWGKAREALEEYETKERICIRETIMEHYADSVIGHKEEILGSIFDHHQRLMEGDFKPDKSDACKYCHLSKVCKVALGGGDE